MDISLKEMFLDVGHYAENNMTEKLFPCILGHCLQCLMRHSMRKEFIQDYYHTSLLGDHLAV